MPAAAPPVLFRVSVGWNHALHVECALPASTSRASSMFPEQVGTHAVMPQAVRRTINLELNA